MRCYGQVKGRARRGELQTAVDRGSKVCTQCRNPRPRSWYASGGRILATCRECRAKNRERRERSAG